MKKVIIIVGILVLVVAVYFLTTSSSLVSQLETPDNQELTDTDRNPTSADNAPTGSIHNLPVPEAVSVVKRYIADDEKISEGLVIIMTAYEKTWTNGCLDLAQEDEMCTEALVTGYEVSVQGSKGIRVFHTNDDGSSIREMICPGPNCKLDKNIPF